MKDKDLSSKDKDKDCILVLKDTSLRTRTNITGTWELPRGRRCMENVFQLPDAMRDFVGQKN